MKKRLLAWLLAVVVVIGLLPAVALADETETEVALSTDGTVEIGGATYKLWLAQNTGGANGSFSYWLDFVNRGFIPGTETNEFRYYLFLRASNNAEATQEVYEQFWKACEITDVTASSTNGVSIGDVATFADGYHKYVPVQVTGEQSGLINVVITQNNITCTLRKDFKYTAATKLELEDGASSYSISVENAGTNQSYFYYIDLGEPQTVTVSGTLSDVSLGRLVLAQTAEGTGEFDLWQHFSGMDVRTYERTITTDKILLRVVSNDSVTEGEALTINGTVTVTAAQSGGGNQSGEGDQTGSETEENLPYYGFYSAGERSEANYLSSVTLTGAGTDLTKIWFIGKNTLKTSVDDVITVTAGDIDITSTNVKVVDDYTLEITLPNGSFGSMYYISVQRNGSNWFGIKVTKPSGGDTQPNQGDYAAYIDGYVIGFAEKRADGEVTKICESAANIFGHGTIENTSPDVPYQKEVDICIAAAKKSADTTGTVIYEVDSTVTDSVVIKRLWLETLSGDNTTYSWSGDELVTELTSVQEEPVPLYVKEGRNCEATVYAEIAVTVGEQTYEQTIRMNIGLVIVDFSGLTRPDNDTVEQLNVFLAELAGQINTTDSKNEIYDIKLGSTTYEGTIHVPAAFKRYQASLHFDGTAKNGKQTVVKGGLDINGAFIEYIRDIHFVADESSVSQTRAIFGGGLNNVENCSFYGYDIALDSSEGLINASNSVFVNNEIAASVNINGNINRDNILPNDWNGNTFINNGSAVQIQSLAASVSPYYFRIYDSNFINNGTDIDARCGGTLYMYRNYFGQYKEVDGHCPHPGKYRHDRHNGRDDLRLDDLLAARTESKLDSILDYARAKIHTENGTKVVTNPRWLHPVKDWWGHNVLVNDTFFGTESASYELITLNEEPEYENVLVADWEDGTVILNEEANSLRLDASAFDGTAEKEIGVLDENEETLGTWNFE